VKELQGGKD
jgi:hypothetical protein